MLGRLKTNLQKLSSFSAFSPSDSTFGDKDPTSSRATVRRRDEGGTRDFLFLVNLSADVSASSSDRDEKIVNKEII